MGKILKTYILAIVSGIALAISFPSWHIFPLAWIALVPLFWKSMRLKSRESFCHFFVAGWVLYSILLLWLLTNVFWAGGVAVLGYQALCVIMAIYWGLLGLTFAWIRNRTRIPAPIVITVLWAAMEFLQSRLFSGFGWGSIAYSQAVNLPFVQLAALGGGLLLSSIVVMFNMIIVKAISSCGKRLRFVFTAALIIVIAHGAGYVLIDQPDTESKPFNVGIFQSDFPLEMKYDPAYTEDMVQKAVENSIRLSKRKNVDLIVWPEALVMGDIETPAIQQSINSLTTQTSIPLFTGAVRFDRASSAGYNSSYFINEKGEIVGHYDKIHLAPFGEYVPFSKYLPFISKVIPSVGNIDAGSEQRVFNTGDRRFGPLICFEVLFDNMADDLRRDGADMLVVITNMAWFGASNAITQELEIARLRAIETRLPIVQCSNTGISGVFDPWGRFTCITSRVSPQRTIMRRASGVLSVPERVDHPFPYGPRYFPWLMIAIAAVLILITKFSSGNKSESPGESV